ncbi:hypothetical protein BHE74_00023190 [Ensete ventricosum]|nr:hypothetical protein GW17_00039682 [Ensete ventricosum]RWW69233.1 hypothetical protein BHE74_00023190 [Ensete ventricosum]
MLLEWRWSPLQAAVRYLPVYSQHEPNSSGFYFWRSPLFFTHDEAPSDACVSSTTSDARRGGSEQLFFTHDEAPSDALLSARPPSMLAEEVTLLDASPLAVVVTDIVTM